MVTAAGNFAASVLGAKEGLLVVDWMRCIPHKQKKKTNPRMEKESIHRKKVAVNARVRPVFKMTN